jgi:tRNA-Thr(GGU) m(6)t(6)A37 methyltransferase TsaA
LSTVTPAGYSTDAAMAIPIPPKDYRDAVGFPECIELRPIGVVRSPYTERHGTPRQAVMRDRPGIRASDVGQVRLFDDVVPARAIADIAGFERIWLLCWLHLNGRDWPQMVRPPGETRRRSVLATRAPHRPNPIALSCVRLLRVEGTTLHVEGLDLIDGTPVIDIKPYVPYADAFADARAGWLDDD